ncbi:MAG: molybdopterin-dependent oxidoreductase [Pseudomonadales bacterium]|nr:molybdopterin-dependent oxidoreductase [Pseudomonadales bacterium]
MQNKKIEVKTTFCRICEASCGMVAHLEDGRITKMEPNKDHIGTLGFSCMKGLHQHKMYDSPDRLTKPLKKIGDKYVPISWPQALQEIGDKVKALRAVSPQSISMYVGTAAGFSILHPIFAEGFMQGIGSHNVFSSATQDCANRFASASEMYGFPFFQPFPDLENINYLMIVGTNPVVSKWTFLQVAHPVKRLKEIKARGGQIMVVDPRYNETAKVAEQHQFIQPNSDVFFFLSFLHEIFAIDGIAWDRVRQHMSGIDTLKELVKDWSPETTAPLTDIQPEHLRTMVYQFVNAKGAAIVTGTGLGMGKHGTLAHWLAEVINAVTGNLDQTGGTLVGRGIFDFAEFAKKNQLFTRDKRSRIGGFRELNGGFPGGILADEILTPGKDQIKAMFVTGGNPLMTMANAERLKSALESLELLVVTDIYMNETASLAHYILPATSPLQRPDLPFVFPLFMGMQSIPYLAATDKIVDPEGEQRDEASIYFDLAEACGVNLFNEKGLQFTLRLMNSANRLKHSFKTQFSASNQAYQGLPQTFILDLMLRLSKNGRFKDLIKQSDGKSIPGAKADDFLSQRPLWEDRKVRLVPTSLVEEARKLGDIFNQEVSLKRNKALRLISKRVHSTHNSWTQNIVELTHSKKFQTNYLYMHPSDAEFLKLKDNDVVDVKSDSGTIRVPLHLLKEIKPGSVALQHGWGHQHAKGLSVASNLAGANVNILAADGPDNIEHISGMVHLTGIPVTVSKSTEAIDKKSWSGLPA